MYFTLLKQIIVYVDLCKRKLSVKRSSFIKYIQRYAIYCRFQIDSSRSYCLVFRKKDLYLVITQKLIFWNPADFMKSGGFHVKSTQNLIKSDVSTKTLQFRGCREGAMTQDFMKSWVIAPLVHSSNWIVLVETFAFVRFWVDFIWNLLISCEIHWILCWFHEIRRISCEIERPLARNCNPMF